MTKLLIVICALLVGCQTTKENPVIIVPEERIVHLDKQLLEPCAKHMIPLAPTGPASSALPEDLYRNVADNAKLYEACKNKQDASIVQLKKFANIKEPNE